ncbi:MAG TPA: hypothetical protein VFP22_11440 [Candidatus Limnocylindrales bacterium]|nr:hypothetical protein [Candidatus Limnocylindrales bacterium]
MTSSQRFEQDLPALLSDLYVGGQPDYRDDLIRATAATRQRPAWTFPERWLPVELTVRRIPVRPLPLRSLAIALVLLALAAAGLILATGSHRRLPPEFGPAGNGPIAFAANGDIFVRDGLTGAITPLVTGPTDDSGPGNSGDGTRLAFVRMEGNLHFLMVANADGSNPVRILDKPLADDWESWSNDSTRLAVSLLVDGKKVLKIAAADGSGVTDVPLGDLAPSEVQWRPDDRQLLVRGTKPDGSIDLYTVNLDGSGLHRLGLPSHQIFGPDWDLTGITWMPTAGRIAYNAVEPDPVTGQDEFRIHLVNADGTHDLRLPGPVGGINQAWTTLSPDGKTILAQRFTFQPSEGWLVLLPADGSGPGREIGTHHVNGDTMRQIWSPDGKQILLYFGKSDFVSIDPNTGLETKLAWQVDDLPDWRRVAP